MKKSLFVPLLLLQIGLLSACAKPDRITRVNSPAQGIYFTVETWHGHGAIDNDFTRIYAHVENGNRSGRELVLSGEYLQDTKITWLNPDEATLCIPNGFTDTFRSSVTIEAGGRSETIRSHLRDHCAVDAITGSAQYNQDSGDEIGPPRLKRK
jgi:hypothetical protein